jgi:pimeloyl-ACP methyl ester carboxylesterase
VTPAWLDRSEYPFESRWIDTPAGRVHYLDEGEGPVVFMVHGTPTWSFLYRRLIAPLRARYRCVAPDLPGFGLSERPAGWSYRPHEQARIVAAIVDGLGLKDFTLVVHDFGGPIGLAYALDHPENVRRLVLFNTWMWSLRGDRRLEWSARLFDSRLGRWLYERAGFAVRVLWRTAVKDARAHAPKVRAHYLGPMESRAARHATWVYAHELLGSSDWYASLWARRERLARIPALLVWGMKDPAFGGFLARWRSVFQRAEVLALEDCGHAPPEERAAELLPTLERFLQAA